MYRTFGEVPGYQEGYKFRDRQDVYRCLVHCHNRASIVGAESEGAESVILSGWYEDDVDNGNEIIYTGQGGIDPSTGRQSREQTLVRGNMALKMSWLNGTPVRVIRGHKLNSVFAPKSGYRYDGLYRVEDCWQEVGKSGFLIWRFRLFKVDAGGNPVPSHTVDDEKGFTVTPRVKTIVRRVVRDTEAARRVKELHDHHCQMCGVRLETPSGYYAEAAHIRPLGRPHDGPDMPENLLCLCPNHHVLFDYGALTMNDDLTLNGEMGRLRTLPTHRIGLDFIRYHRAHYGHVHAAPPLPETEKRQNG